MELIKRLIAWTPSDLGRALTATSCLSGFVIALMLIGFDGEIWSLAGHSVPAFGMMLLMIGFTTVMAAFCVWLGLAVFGLAPTLWLKHRFVEPWAGLTTILWGGASAALFAWIVIEVGTEQFAFHEVPVVFIGAGSVTGLIWWILARRVIKRDLRSTRKPS